MAIYNFGPWETKRLPVLDSNYPENVTVLVGTDATFSVAIAKEGKPEEYTYQWYKNGEKVEGATETSYSFYRSLEGSDTVFCEVTNKAGKVKSRTATLKANRLYLYDYGNQYDAVTGGWVAARSGENSNDSYVNSLTHFENHMSILGRKNEYVGAAGTSLMIDLSRHTRLNAMVSSNVESSYMRVSSTLDGFDAGTLAADIIPTEIGTISLDISNIASGHVVFTADANDTVGYTTWVYSVWLG